MFTLARSISSWYLISKVSFSWYADFCFSSACKSLYRKNIHEFQISFLYADKLFIDKNIMTILFWPWMTTGPQWEIYKIIRFICIHHNLRVPPPPWISEKQLKIKYSVFTFWKNALYIFKYIHELWQLLYNSFTLQLWNLHNTGT